jgi:hypothetical protein
MKAMVHARAAGELALEARVARYQAPYFIWGPGRVEEGLRYTDELVDRLGHVPAVREFGVHVRSHLRARLGRFDGVVEGIEDYRRRMRELGHEREYAGTADCVWDVCYWTGRWTVGEAALREAMAINERIGVKDSLPDYANSLGQAAYLTGRLDEADRHSEEAERVTASDDPLNGAGWRIVRARVLATRGDLTPPGPTSSRRPPARGSRSPRSSVAAVTRRPTRQPPRHSTSTNARETSSAPAGHATSWHVHRPDPPSSARGATVSACPRCRLRP